MFVDTASIFIVVVGWYGYTLLAPLRSLRKHALFSLIVGMLMSLLGILTFFSPVYSQAALTAYHQGYVGMVGGVAVMAAALLAFARMKRRENQPGETENAVETSLLDLLFPPPRWSVRVLIASGYLMLSFIIVKAYEWLLAPVLSPPLVQNSIHILVAVIGAIFLAWYALGSRGTGSAAFAHVLERIWVSLAVLAGACIPLVSWVLPRYPSGGTMNTSVLSFLLWVALPALLYFGTRTIKLAFPSNSLMQKSFDSSHSNSL